MKKEDMLELILKIKMQSTALEISKDPVNEYIHPTQKPVALSETAINNSSPYGGIAYEPFAGSGSATEVSAAICHVTIGGCAQRTGALPRTCGGDGEGPVGSWCVWSESFMIYEVLLDHWRFTKEVL